MNDWTLASDALPPERATIEARIVNEDGSLYGDVICERIGDYLFYCGIGQVVVTASSPAFAQWRFSDGADAREDNDDL
jgi:hypothetical protein